MRVDRTFLIAGMLAFLIFLIMRGGPDVAIAQQGTRIPSKTSVDVVSPKEILRTVYLAGGCFWGVEAFMDRIPGVTETEVGYANGTTANPTYEEVCNENTGHAETVRVQYDPHVISLEKLLRAFFSIIDPTSKNRQGYDIGKQYRTGVYFLTSEDQAIAESFFNSQRTRYEKPLAVELLPLENYYPAEEYHQKYLEKNPNGYCHVNFEKLKEIEPLLPLQKPLTPKSVSINPSEYAVPTDAELKKKLTELQYRVTQEGATESPFTNEYYENKEPGIYVDITTGEPLFSSLDKYHSGSGWPSFTRPINPEVLKENTDTAHGMVRNEIRSRIGNAHLGHVFDDGPTDQGGLRYCINSAALRFIPLKDLEKEGYGKFKALFE